jgi:hypothetical protein
MHSLLYGCLLPLINPSSGHASGTNALVHMGISVIRLSE